MYVNTNEMFILVKDQEIQHQWLYLKLRLASIAVVCIGDGN